MRQKIGIIGIGIVGAPIARYFEEIKKLTGNKIAVIRSTVTPGTTENFQKKYWAHKILFNPEFLDAKFNWEQFIKPSRQIIGSTTESKNVSGLILSLLPDAPFKSEIGATEAELVKYASN